MKRRCFNSLTPTPNEMCIRDRTRRGRTQGLTEGRTQGLAEGRAEGRSSMARLIDKLLEENRIEDCKRIAKDPEFCQHLMEEFGIE